MHYQRLHLGQQKIFLLNLIYFEYSLGSHSCHIVNLVTQSGSLGVAEATCISISTMPFKVWQNLSALKARKVLSIGSELCN